MAELRQIIVFHCRHFDRHIGICNPICVKLLQVMFGVIPHNLKKRRLYLKPFSWRPQTRHTHTHTHTHTHKHIHTHTYTHIDTHDDSNRRNAMNCISPIKSNIQILLQIVYCRYRVGNSYQMVLNPVTHLHTLAATILTGLRNM